MAKVEALYIKRIVDGEEHYFPSDTERAKVTYTYTAKRMGGAPTVEATLYFERCLDKEWTRAEFVEFGGERYYIDQVPSSSKDNTTCMYKHDLTFYSRRAILDNVLFFDAVSIDEADTKGGDVYRSNMTSFTFYGTLQEFVDRINDSLAYVGLYDTEKEEGYRIVIDSDIDTTVTKELSFEDKTITEVLQELYNTFELSYYWVGTTCHVGYSENAITTPIKYGRNESLLSVAKENCNNAIANMVTGHGSSDNLPYYYPNGDEYGTPMFHTENFSESLIDKIDLAKVFKWDSNIYNDKLVFCQTSAESYTASVMSTSTPYAIYPRGGITTGADSRYKAGTYPILQWSRDGLACTGYIGTTRGKTVTGGQWSAHSEQILLVYAFSLSNIKGGSLDFSKIGFNIQETAAYTNNGTSTPDSRSLRGWTFTMEYDCYYCDTGAETLETTEAMLSKTFGKRETYDNFSKIGHDQTYTFANKEAVVIIVCTITGTAASGSDSFSQVKITPATNDTALTFTPTAQYYLEYGTDGSTVALDDSGISVSSIASIPKKTTSYVFADGAWKASTASGGSTAGALYITGREWVMPTGYLMPTVYRKTQGKERFLYALDNTHLLPDSTTEYYTFENQYTEGNPHMASVSFDDIKPTINGVYNASGQLFGEIADVAFDENDSDTTTGDGDSQDYDHPYFYIKLHKYDGDFGFDLFAHALASDAAKINLIDSVGCPACSFEIMCLWDEAKNKCYNPVKTDTSGNIVSGDSSAKLATSTSLITKANQNSNTNEIWIALKKDGSTLGVVMPNAAGGFKPKAGERFVITGIEMPGSLVSAAEARLDAALVAYMSENNAEKFSYTVKFSRIFLTENTEFASLLNENARLPLEYNGETHVLYVNNYTVKSDGEILEEIEVELTDELTVSQSEMRQQIDAVKGDTISTVTKMFGGSGSALNSGDILAKGLQYFLRKDTADTASGVITFLKGLKLGSAYSISEAGDALLRSLTVSSDYGITKEGLATFAAAIAEAFSTPGYTGPDMHGAGASVYEASGLGHIVTDYLTVRIKAIFAELEIRKLTYVGGNYIFSHAGSTIIEDAELEGMTVGGKQIKAVEAVTNTNGRVTGYKVRMKSDDGTTRTQNMWRVGDMALCQTFNVKAGTTRNAANRYYWRLVTETGTETAEAAKTVTGSNGTQTTETEERTVDYIVLSNETAISGYLMDGDDKLYAVGWDGSNASTSIFTGIDPCSRTNTVATSSNSYEAFRTAANTASALGFGTLADDIPQGGDVIVQVGFQGDSRVKSSGVTETGLCKERGGVVEIVTEGIGGEPCPAINVYSAINDYRWSSHKTIQISADGIDLHAKYLRTLTESGAGEPFTVFNYRGAWDSGTSYSYGDVVTYGGQTYVWGASSDSSAGDKPGTNSGWTLAASKGTDGAAGKDGKDALRNLLVGSSMEDLTRLGGVIITNTTRNTVAADADTTYMGTPSLKIMTTLANYNSGVYFRPIAIKRNTKYHASVWAKGSGTFAIEGIYQTAPSADDSTRAGVWALLYTDATLSDEWTRYDAEFTTGSTYDWLELNFWCNDAGTEAHLSRFMLEEGDYKGWTLNEADLKGDDGASGKGIASVAEHYLATSLSSGVSASTDGWDTYTTLTASRCWLWNYEVTTYTDGSTSSTTPHIIGHYGADGKGISSITDYYLASASESGVTTSTSGWGTVTATTAEKPYLWNYEHITYTDGTSEDTPPRIIGVRGKDGADGTGYEIRPVTEVAAVTVTGAASGDNITYTGKLNVSCEWKVYKVEGGAVSSSALSGVTVSSAAYNTGATTGLSKTSSGTTLKVTGSNITYSSASDGRTSITVQFTYGGAVIGARTVPIILHPASLQSATESMWSSVVANKNSISQIQQDSNSISLKVDSLTTRTGTLETDMSNANSSIGGLTDDLSALDKEVGTLGGKIDALQPEAKNILPMGNEGQIVRTGIYQMYNKTIEVEKGKTYTVTWKGRSQYSSVYIRLYVYDDAWAHYAAADVVNNTANTVHSLAYTAQASETVHVSLYYMNSSGADPGSYPYRAYISWVRVDEGDLTANPPTEWEASDEDVEAVNLMPDHLLENAISSTYEDSMGSREKIDSDSGLIMGLYTDTDTGTKRIQMQRKSGYNGTDIADGLRWYLPFRGAGAYSVGASFYYHHSTYESTGNGIFLEVIPCSADKTRIGIVAGISAGYTEYDSSVSTNNWSTNYGWQHREQTVEIAASYSGTAVEWIEMRLLMTRNGLMSVKHMCLSKCSHATRFNAQELSEARAAEAAQLATGIDIYNHRILVTTDQFVVRNNSGAVTAYINKDGVLEANDIVANGGTFQGVVRATNFFQRVCVNGVSNMMYYHYDAESDPHVGYGYSDDAYTLEDGTDASQLANQDTTGTADIVLVALSRTVTLPRAKDFEGKVVEVYDVLSGTNNSDIAINIVDNGGFASDGYEYFGVGVSGSRANNLIGGGPNQITTRYLVDGFGSMARFVSMKLTANGTGSSQWWWIELTNNTTNVAAASLSDDGAAVASLDDDTDGDDNTGNTDNTDNTDSNL